MIQILDLRPLPPSIMPVDVAVRLCLAHSPPLAKFLNPYDDSKGRKLVTRYKPLRPCLSLKKDSDACNSDWSRSKNRSKKRVVFADSKGLALTTTHVFSDCMEEGMLDLQFDMIDLEDITAGLKLHEERNLILGFTQPSADYLAFRNRLQKNFVCLENCTLQERSIAGTIKVKNLSFTKKVQVRITYDSWKSFTDLDCTYMNNVYGGSDSDTFSFVIDLPPSVPTQDKMEFCVSFESEGQIFWDNNEGHNYKVVHAEWKSDGVQVPMPPKTENQVIKRQFKPHRIDFDHFGSPRASNGLFPEMQSWSRIGNTAPYW